MLQVCLNGARSPREHHHLPVRPEELARAAAKGVTAGATGIHLHPKTADGADSLTPHTVATTLRAVRAAAPGVPVSIATGSWTFGDPEERVAAVRSWTVLPDQASVNWHEPGAEEVAQALDDRGVGIEAGIPSGTDADERFARSPLRHRVQRVLAEVTDPTARSGVTAEALLRRLPDTDAPVLLHGRGRGAWPVLHLALRRGFDARIGLEDTLVLPDGRIAADNAELVAAAIARIPTGS